MASPVHRRRKRSLGERITPPTSPPAGSAEAKERARGIHKVFSVAEVREQERVIEDLLVRGLGHGTIFRAVREPPGTLAADGKPRATALGIGQARARKLIDRIYERWRIEDGPRRAQRKAEQIRRLTHDAEVARSSKNYNAVARFEELLADLMGTREPIQVNHDVRVSETVLHVFGMLRPEDMHDLMNEYRQTHALAEQARRLLPASHIGTAQ
jgi:hypothetical protein